MILQYKIRQIDEAKIEAAIADFERTVDCELVPVITKSSSYVEHITWLLSLFFAIIFISIIDLSLQNSWAPKVYYYIPALIASYILGRWLDQLDYIDRFFISKRERARQVFEKAQRTFFLKRLHETKTHNAVLLFVSVMERQIVILADPQMKIEGLNEIQHKMLAIVQKHFAASRFEDGFIEAIQFLKAELVSKYPQKDLQAANQLSNKLIWADV